MEPPVAKATPPAKPSLGVLRYLGAVAEASRPHFFAFPIGGVLAGMAATGTEVPILRVALGALIAGGGWGAGQLLNDVLDREADAVDAPHRPAVRGLLPARLTITVALLFGLSLLGILTHLTPQGWVLGIMSMALILTYNRLKAVPLGGNLSHGVLLSVAALIGSAIAKPDSSLVALVTSHWVTYLLVGSWAALYLQANYEKDIVGDEVGGYRTLAHLLGVRRSSVLRGALTGVCALTASAVSVSPLAKIIGITSSVAIMVAAVVIAYHGTSSRALSLYRVAVHGGTFGMLALGSTVVSASTFLGMLVVAGTLTELAFLRSPNP